MQDEKDIELKEAVETEEEKLDEAVEAEEAKLDAEDNNIEEAEEVEESKDDFGADDFGEFADLENQIKVETNESKKVVSSAKDANYASGFPNWYLEPPTDF